MNFAALSAWTSIRWYLSGHNRSLFAFEKRWWAFLAVLALLVGLSGLVWAPTIFFLPQSIPFDVSSTLYVNIVTKTITFFSKWPINFWFISSTVLWSTPVHRAAVSHSTSGLATSTTVLASSIKSTSVKWNVSRAFGHEIFHLFCIKQVASSNQKTYSLHIFRSRVVESECNLCHSQQVPVKMYGTNPRLGAQGRTLDNPRLSCSDGWNASPRVSNKYQQLFLQERFQFTAIPPILWQSAELLSRWTYKNENSPLLCARRILNPEKSEMLLEATRFSLAASGLQLVKSETITGHEEGTDGWITVNFLKGVLHDVVRPVDATCNSFRSP